MVFFQEDQEISTVAALPPTGEIKTKITPTSSEDDWEKADMEVQRVDDEVRQSTLNVVNAQCTVY